MERLGRIAAREIRQVRAWGLLIGIGVCVSESDSLFCVALMERGVLALPAAATTGVRLPGRQLAPATGPTPGLRV